MFFGEHWQVINATQFVVAFALTVYCLMRHSRDVSALAGRWLLWLFAYSMVIIFTSFSFGEESFFWTRHVFYFSISATYFMFFRLAARFQATFTILKRILIAFALINATIGVWGVATGSRLLVPNDSLAMQTTLVGTFGYEEGSGRSGGFTGENYAGVWQTPAIAWAGLQIFSTSLSLLPASVALASGLAIAVSMSRTSVVCGLASLLITMLVSVYRKALGWRTLVSLVVLGIVVLAGYHILAYFMESFSSKAIEIQRERFSLDSTDISSGRFDIWRDAIGVCREYPFFGRGVTAAKELVGAVPHNAFLDILVSTGLVGFLIFYAPLAFLAWRIWHYRRSLMRDANIAYMICVAAGAFPAMMTLTCAYEQPIMWVIWGLLAGSVDVAMDNRRAALRSASALPRRSPPTTLQRPDSTLPRQQRIPEN